MRLRTRLSRDFVLIWLVLVGTGLWLRPLTPIDETRAVSVAWEMWLRHDPLVPVLNGIPYSHKPPLLQWCIQLLWLLFGVGEWSARLVVPLFALANLYLTAALAHRLWPQRPAAETLAPWLLLAMPVWALWTSLTLYDMLSTFFTLLGMLGVLRAGQGQARGTWSLLALALGGGILAKGPVILLLALPTALFAPWWLAAVPAGGWGRWYRGMGLAIGGGALMGLAWAMPAGWAGGEEYRRLIFWGQSAGRIANSFAHQRPPWWYLEWLPLLLFPWVWWLPLWQRMRHPAADSGQRFCLVQMLFILAVFSLISGKQIHYLLPAFPAAALLFARGLADLPAASRRARLPVAGVIILLGVGLLALPHLPSLASRGSLQGVLAVPLAVDLAILASGLALLALPRLGVAAEVRALSLSVLAVVVAAHFGYREQARSSFDLQPLADRVAAIQAGGSPLLHWRKYNGQYHFLGRLRQPIADTDSLPRLLQWLAEHPDGHLIVESRSKGPVAAGVEFSQPYKSSSRVELWRAATALERLRSGHTLMD